MEQLMAQATIPERPQGCIQKGYQTDMGAKVLVQGQQKCSYSSALRARWL